MSHFQGRKEQRPDVTAEDVYTTLESTIESQLPPAQPPAEPSQVQPSTRKRKRRKASSSKGTAPIGVPAGHLSAAGGTADKSMETNTQQREIPRASAPRTSPEVLLPVFQRSFHLSTPFMRSTPLPVIAPLPPSLATLNAFGRLLDTHLDGVDSLHVLPAPSCTAVRGSMAYRALFNRFRALFLWPALLAELDPHATPASNGCPTHDDGSQKERKKAK